MYNSHLGLATWDCVCVCVNAFDAAFIVCWTYEGTATNQAMCAICDEQRWMRGHRYSFAPTKRKWPSIEVPEWRLHGWQFKLTQMKRTFIAIWPSEVCRLALVSDGTPKANIRQCASTIKPYAECSPFVREKWCVCSPHNSIQRFSLFKGNGTVFHERNFNFHIFLLWCRRPSKRPTADRLKWNRRWMKKKSSVLNWLNILLIFLTLALLRLRSGGGGTQYKNRHRIFVSEIEMLSLCVEHTHDQCNGWLIFFATGIRDVCVSSELCGHRNRP